MKGKTAAPSGTSEGSAASLMSASSHRGNDRQFVAVLDSCVEKVQVAHVLVIDVQIDESAHLAVLEQAAGDGGILRREGIKHGLDRMARDFNRRLALGMLPHRCRNLHLDSHYRLSFFCHL